MLHKNAQIFVESAERDEEMSLESFQKLNCCMNTCRERRSSFSNIFCRAGGSLVVHSIHNNVRCMLCVSRDKHSWRRKSSLLSSSEACLTNFEAIFCAFFWSVYTKPLLTHDCRLLKTCKTSTFPRRKLKSFKGFRSCIPDAALINSNASPLIRVLRVWMQSWILLFFRFCSNIHSIQESFERNWKRFLIEWMESSLKIPAPWDEKQIRRKARNFLRSNLKFRALLNSWINLRVVHMRF